MTKQKDVGNEYVKKSTLLVVSLLALAVGFFGGVVLSIYKSGSGVPVPTSMPQQQTVEGKRPSTAQAGMIAALEKETLENPRNVEAWIQLGNTYFDTDQFEKAISAYEKSLILDPNNADVQTDLGVMYRRNGESVKAIGAFDKAIKINPRHEASRFNKGVVLMHDLNNPKGAVEAWEGLVTLNPLAKAPSGISVKEMLEKLKKEQINKK